MKLLLVFLTLALDFSTIEVFAESTDVIDTTLGPVQGEILATIGNNVEYSSFKGIRYGDPQKRFEAPFSPSSWSDVKSATKAGPDCSGLIGGKYYGEEDCLYLNVFSPLTNFSNRPEELKAVMFWIHGPRFEYGTSDPKKLGPDFLIEDDVVVVTINYRVGPLGFMALHNREAKEPYAVGNAGLKDQQFALVWVKQNIEKFGGDPGKVTLFGQGSGGAMTLFHANSDTSQGLFSGIISMSAVPLDAWAFETISESEKMAFEVGRRLGLDTNDKDELLNLFNEVSAENLTLATRTISPPFRPTREDPSIGNDRFFDGCLIDQYKSGNFSQVPYILGFMKDETLAYTGSEAIINAIVAQASKVAEDYNVTFAVPSLFNRSGDDWRKRMVKETTDLYMIAGCEDTVRYLSENGNKPVYHYEISVVPSSGSLHQRYLNVNEPGAANADDLAYLWWDEGAGLSLDPSDELSITRARVTRMWTNFAKFGNPTPDGTNDSLLNVTWPDYRSTSNILNIDSELRVEPYVNENANAIIKGSAWRIKSGMGCDDY